MSSIEEEVIKYCISRNLCLVTKESLEMMHRPIVVETKNKDAIPIEWVERYIKLHNLQLREDKRHGRGKIIEMQELALSTLKGLLEDWEKENGKR